MRADDGSSTATVLVAADDQLERERLVNLLTDAGHDAVPTPLDDAIDQLHATLADLVIYLIEPSDDPGVSADGRALIQRIRSDGTLRATRLLLLIPTASTDRVAREFALDVSEYLRVPYDDDELRHRVHDRLRRPHAGADDRVAAGSSLTEPEVFARELSREFVRTARGGANGAIAVLRFPQEPIRTRFGPRAVDLVFEEVAARVLSVCRPIEIVTRAEDGVLVALVPDTSPSEAQRRLQAMADRISGAAITVKRENLRLAVSAGFAMLTDAPTPEMVVEHAHTAADHARAQRDPRPQRWSSEVVRGDDNVPTARRGAFATTAQVAAVVLLGLGVPFAAYVGLAANGIDISWWVAVTIAGGLSLSAIASVVDAVVARRLEPLPEPTGIAPPGATAVITAHLPEDAPHLLETVRCFQDLDYPRLEILVAYSTYLPLPIERALVELGNADARVVPIRVEGSTSKAQNVNVALAHAHGAFIGMFDADHRPAPDAFRRAWRWLSSGDDIVQGHSVVRNGTAGHVTRLAAVDAEIVQAVGEPARARMHGFGLFGSANGFWRTDLLQHLRLRGRSLTEDVETSLRVLAAGGSVRNDPGLVSHQLAPITWRRHAVWRMRQARGGARMPMRELTRWLASDKLRLRTKLGLVDLVLRRSVGPWFAWQIVPLVAFWAWQGSLDRNLTPIAALVGLYVLTSGCLQALLAYGVSDRSVRRPWWFLAYLAEAPLFYTELNRMIARVAQVRALFRVPVRRSPPTPSAAHEAPPAT